MRIRTELENWNWKKFLAVYGIFVLFYGTFFTMSGYFQDFENFFVPTLLINVGLMPLIMAGGISYSFRSKTLYVNDYDTIPDFKNALLKHTLNKNLVIQSETENAIVFKPTNWFYRLANSWGKTEYVTITWGTEIIVNGPSHRVQQIDDSLRWNGYFKS